MAKAFVWWSESGGPGKTTNAMQTAAAIARDGYDVLAMDLDPQRGALTHYCGYEELDHDNREEDHHVDQNIMDVFFDDVPIQDIIVETPHFDLVPGHEDLSEFESSLSSSGRRGVDEYWVIREQLENLANDYDVFILDCQATLNVLVDNAIIAARNIMVPLELSPKGDASQQGLEETVRAMNDGFSKMGVEVAIKGAVPSRVGDAKIFEKYRDRMDEREMPLSPFSVPEHSLLRYTWENQMDLFQFMHSENTRSLREYEEHVPLAFKVVGRWMTDDYTYKEAIKVWDKVKDRKMGDAEPEKLLDEDADNLPDSDAAGADD